MADLYLNGVTTSKARVGNNSRVFASGTKDGALYTAHYALAAALEGKLFTAQVGTATTPVAFRVGYDADQPELVVDVPSGVAIIPVSIDVVLENAAGTDNEVVAEASPALSGAGTSTAGVLLSHRLNSGIASACKFYYTYSGNSTAPASYIEFFRFNHAFADEADVIIGNAIKWRMAESAPLVLVGPASLLLHVAGTGTAPEGYLKVAFMEFAASEV